MRNLKQMITGLIAFMVLSTSAQESDLFSLSLEELMDIEITTASRRAQRISDAPATVVSYSAAQIEQFGWRDLKDMFRAVLGMDVSYDVQGEVKTLATIRGVEGNQKILILQDGQRINPITGERFIFGHNIPLSIYQRIEIVYGPASALYGADAYAGVINLITKDGEGIDGFSGNLGYVSTGAVDGSLAFGKKIDDDTDVMLFGRIYNGYDFPYHEHYTDALDYEAVSRYTGRLGELDNVYPIQNWNFIGKIRYKRLLLGFDWQHQLESNAPSTIPANYAYVRNNVWGQDIRHIYGVLQVIEGEDFSLEANVRFGDYEINPASNFYIPIDSNGDGLLNDGAPGYKYGYSGYGQGGLKADWRPMGGLVIISGFTYDNVISFPKTQNLTQPYSLDAGLQDDLSFFVDDNGYTFGMVGLEESIFGERNYYNIGSYVQTEYKPLEMIIITLGGRFDYNSIYGQTFNPRLGVVYKPTSTLNLKAMAGTAYIAPSNYYRWENWANPYAMHVPNLDIKPERLTSFELSALYYVNRNLSVRTGLFRNEMSDIIRPLQAPEQQGAYPYYNPMRQLIGEDPATGYIEINANLGEIYAQGIELDMNYQLGDAIISLGYSYTDGEDRETGYKLAKVSQHKINSNILYSQNRFFGSLSVRYYSDIWTAPSNDYYKGEKQIPGATLLYANMGYRFNESVTFTLSGDNLLNTKHWGASPYGEGIWIQSRAPQSMLKIFAGVTVRF